MHFTCIPVAISAYFPNISLNFFEVSFYAFSAGENVTEIHAVPSTYLQMRENVERVLHFMSSKKIKMHRIQAKGIRLAITMCTKRFHLSLKGLFVCSFLVFRDNLCKLDPDQDQLKVLLKELFEKVSEKSQQLTTKT